MVKQIKKFMKRKLWAWLKNSYYIVTDNPKRFEKNNFYIKKQDQQLYLLFKDVEENLLIEALFMDGYIEIKEEILTNNEKNKLFTKKLEDNESHFFTNEHKIYDIFERYSKKYEVEYFTFNNKPYLINNLEDYFEKYKPIHLA